MLKKMLSTTGFLTAWLFAFSLLSNCYCAPIAFPSERSAQPGMQSKMPAHCPHHSGAAKEKQSDCAPRYNTDQFESTASQIHFEQKTISADLVTQLDQLISPSLSQGFDFQLILDSSPPSQLYLLHHSFLI